MGKPSCCASDKNILKKATDQQLSGSDAEAPGSRNAKIDHNPNAPRSSHTWGGMVECNLSNKIHLGYNLII